MSPETKQPPFDPIMPDNAVLLLVDQQEGLFSRILEPEQTRHNLLGLARGTKLLRVPTIMTTNPVAGPQLDDLTKLYAGTQVIERRIINAWTSVVYDACGRFEPMPVAAITRLAQAGVVLVNARTIVLEMMADNAHPSANEIYAALSSA